MKQGALAPKTFPFRRKPESRLDALLDGYRLSSVWLISELTKLWEHYTIMRQLVTPREGGFIMRLAAMILGILGGVLCFGIAIFFGWLMAELHLAGLMGTIVPLVMVIVPLIMLLISLTGMIGGVLVIWEPNLSSILMFISSIGFCLALLASFWYLIAPRSGWEGSSIDLFAALMIPISIILIPTLVISGMLARKSAGKA